MVAVALLCTLRQRNPTNVVQQSGGGNRSAKEITQQVGSFTLRTEAKKMFGDPRLAIAALRSARSNIA